MKPPHAPDRPPLLQMPRALQRVSFLSPAWWNTRPLRPFFLALLAFCVSNATTAWLWQHERQNGRLRLQAQFEFGLSDINARIAQRVNAYAEMLRGVQGLYASTNPSREAFRTYVRALQLENGFVGLQGLGVALIVPAEKIAAHTAQMRMEGLTDYRVHPDTDLPIHAPIIQVEPASERNLIALGFDPYSDTIRRQAMEQARSSGDPVISGKLDFGIDKTANERPSFIMYAALIRPQGLEGAHPIGWAYAPVRMKELMASLYGERDPDIELRVYDGELPNPRLLLHDTTPHARLEPALLHAQATLEIAGRSWLVEAHAHHGFKARHGRDDSSLIAISGFFMSSLLAVIAWLIGASRTRAIELATRMSEEYRASEERWKFALEGAGDGVWDRDLRSDTIFFSARCAEILGYSLAELGRHRSEWVSRIHPEDRERALSETRACVEGHTRNFASEYRLRCKNGDWKWILSRGHVTSHDAEGHPMRLIGTITDISERKATEERIRHMAQHDTLTGLPNRALFVDRLQQALSLAHREQSILALCFVDLDGFKAVNDRNGHATGDLLLQEVARRMQAHVRESDTVGRIGGDEFVVLLPGLHALDDASQVAEKIRLSLAAVFEIGPQQLKIAASIGIACYPHHGTTEAELWSHADTAMYAAKQAGGNQIRFSQIG